MKSGHDHGQPEVVLSRVDSYSSREDFRETLNKVESPLSSF